MMPAALRPAFWLGSLSLHAAVLVAASHVELRSQSPGPFAADPTVELATDLVTDPAPILTDARSGSIVPPATHLYPLTPDHDAHPRDPSLVHIPLVRAPPVVLAAPKVVAAPRSPHFAIVVSNSPTSASAAAASAAPQSDGIPEPRSDGERLAEEGVSSPARLMSALPTYPPEARAQEVEADVVLVIVVTTSGRVAEAHIVKPSGMGVLDRAALEGVRTGRFAPARQGGRPVAVRMRFTVKFRLP